MEAMPGQRVPDDVAARWRVARPQPTPELREMAQKGDRGPSLALLGGLDAYVPTAVAPWNRARARHLLKRTGIGATVPAIEAILDMQPGAAVDSLLNGAMDLQPPAEPWWRNHAPPHWTAPEQTQIAWWDANEDHIWEYRIASLDRFLSRGVADPLAAARVCFRDKMALMWHNHVVADLDSHFMAALLHRYWSLLRKRAFGNVKTLIHEVGRTPAMLIYLNGLENQAGSPNENYARELMELFTMGIVGPGATPNYTQSDVVEAARALTGWGMDYYGETDTPLEGVFVPDWHDFSQKTIFGQTGAWGYDELIDLIFQQRAAQTAHFTCRKLYRTFVHDVPDEDIVAELASLLLASNFEIAPVLRTLLKSQHFFDAGLLGAAIKSAIENTYGIWRELGLDPDLDEPDFQGGLNYACSIVGQELFQPPNVAGWPGGRHWMDTSSMTTRWMTNRWYLWRQDGTYRALAAKYPLQIRGVASSLASAIADDMLGLPVDAAVRDQFTQIMLNGQPAYEWDPTSESAENRIRQLIAFVSELPEYQLA